MGWWHKAAQNIMRNNVSKGCRTQGGWQLEVRLLDLHIRQRQAVIREHQQVINQLRAQREEILEHHKHRRRCLWDDDTPMIRLVNLHQLEHFKALMTDWQKRSTETINPKETSHFTFLPNARSHAIRALAVVLAKNPPVFEISTRKLCLYLGVHSNLGTPENIKKALQRAKKEI